MTVLEASDAGSAPAFERSREQRMEALRRANEVRSHRAGLKRRMKRQGAAGGRGLVLDVLMAPGPDEETMTVYELLLAMPKVGRTKATKWLSLARISPSRTVGGLTERQRRELAALVGRCRLL